MTTAEVQCPGDRPAPSISASLPTDVEIPSGHSGDPTAFFDDFSWRSFVALSWPAIAGRRGVPDLNKRFGAEAEEVVWKTWKADHEIFQPNGRPPSPWDSFEANSPDPFASFDKAGRSTVIGWFREDGSGTEIEHYNQAGFGPAVGSLSAQNRTYVRYGISVNRVEFDFIRDNELYLFSNIPKDGQLVFPTGSIELKIAWREFTPLETSDTGFTSRFYTTQAVLIDPDGGRREALLGLVGLHIVHRTPSRPEWVWSSFEHAENLEGDRPLFRDPQGSGDENQLLPVVDENNPPQASPSPVQVSRLKPLPCSTVETNRLYRRHPDVADTVWANYQLVTTQWPVTPAATPQEFVENFTKSYPEGAGNPFPRDDGDRSIANSVMETTERFQRSVSCMRCHFRAGKANHTEFVWTVGLRAFKEREEDRVRHLESLQETAAALMTEVASEDQ